MLSQFITCQWDMLSTHQSLQAALRASDQFQQTLLNTVLCRQ